MSARSPSITVTVAGMVTYELTISVDKTKGILGDTFYFYGDLWEWPQGTRHRGLVNIVLYAGGVKINSIVTNTGHYEFTWTPTVAGTYTVYAEAFFL